MTELVTENNFLIAEGTDGDIYIFVNAKAGHAKSPHIIYDGGEHAIFIRRNEQRIILDYINPEIREALRHAKEVIVVETLVDTIKECYYTPLQIVNEIPLDWSKIGLTTWEDQALKHSGQPTA